MSEELSDDNHIDELNQLINDIKEKSLIQELEVENFIDEVINEPQEDRV